MAVRQILEISCIQLSAVTKGLAKAMEPACVIETAVIKSTSKASDAMEVGFRRC